jgi:peptidoglycan LD-endopeptidase CwlK
MLAGLSSALACSLAGCWTVAAEPVAVQAEAAPQPTFHIEAPAQLEPDPPSLFTREEALVGSAAPPEILAQMALVEVDFLNFEGEVETGQLVVHESLADEVREIFGELLELRFPIEKIVPIVAYDWSDDDSMADNNTSAFNYRRAITGSMSHHAYGRAIDINPRLNPFVIGGRVLPPNARYDTQKPGTIVDGPVVRAFEKRGWRWGGRFKNKDWQHFEKPARRR